ncbi:MAG: hypothetical protein Q8P78_02655 [bacterium]|nr:hypothetical protein [bacterium]
MESMKQVFRDIAVILLGPGVVYGLVYTTSSAADAVPAAAISALIAAVCVTKSITTSLALLGALFLAAGLNIRGISTHGIVYIGISDPIMAGAGLALAVIGAVAFAALARKNGLPMLWAGLAYYSATSGLIVFYVVGRVSLTSAYTSLGLALALAAAFCYVGTSDKAADPEPNGAA